MANLFLANLSYITFKMIQL